MKHKNLSYFETDLHKTRGKRHLCRKSTTIDGGSLKWMQLYECGYTKDHLGAAETQH